VWAPTWVARRDSEVRRLKEALEQACDLGAENAASKADPDPADLKEPLPREVDVQRVQFGGIERIGVPYKVYGLKARFAPYVTFSISKFPYRSQQKNEFHFQCNRELQRNLLAELVENEGPIHFDYAVRRLAAAWGIKRVGYRVAFATKEAVNLCLRDGRVTLKGSFLWPVGLREAAVRVPVEGDPNSMRKPEYIPPEEIEGIRNYISPSRMRYRHMKWTKTHEWKDQKAARKSKWKKTRVFGGRNTVSK
jgi:hypothetical protein